MPDAAALGRKPSLPGQWVDLPPPLAGSLKEPFEIKVYEIDDVERLQRHRPPPREDPAEVRASAGGALGPRGGGLVVTVLGWQAGPLGVWPGGQLTFSSPLPSALPGCGEGRNQPSPAPSPWRPPMPTVGRVGGWRGPQVSTGVPGSCT